MDGDIYLKGDSENSRRKSDEEWRARRDGSPSTLFDSPFGKPNVGAWSRRAWEARRTPSEQVRATIWSKGDEKVITLQWMVLGDNGDWHPCNIPPGPADLE